MNRKLLSIITPVFNDLENLKKTFHTIQEKNELTEHVIIDGNSKDGSFDFAKNLEFKGFAKVFTQKSQTFYGAFNEALKQESGEYVIFLCCGDILKIEKVLSLIKKYSNFDIIAASCSQKVDDHENIYLRSKRPKISIFSTSILHSSLIIKSSIYRKVNLFDESLTVSSDVDCVIKMIKAGAKIKYSDEIICHMEEYGVSKNQYLRKIIDHSIIKYRHVGLLSFFVYIPKRILLDFILIPLWIIYKNTLSPKKWYQTELKNIKYASSA